MTEELLVFADSDEVKKELELADPTAIHAEPGTDPELDQQADGLVEKLISIDPTQSEAAESAKNAIETMGLSLQESASNRSAMLKEPIRKMSSHADDGGDVAKSLVDLKVKVEELDPGDLDLEAGWITRLLGMIPGIGTPLKRYFHPL